MQITHATLMALAALATAAVDAGYAYQRAGGVYAANGLSGGYALGGYAQGGYAQGGYAQSSYAPLSPAGPLTVLAERPYAVDPNLAAVPLVVVPSSQLRVVQDARIAGFSPTRPVVTLQAPEREATPAVRVVLARPMYVSAPQSTISFPAGFTVVHDGLRMPIPVGAVLAPVPSGAFVSAQHPYAIRVVYAVPTGPLPFHYPFHAQYPTFSHPLFIGAGPGTAVAVPAAVAPPRPISPQRPAAPQRPVSPAPAAPAAPALPSRPQQQRPERPPFVSSGRPVVTVLDFPSSIASPPVLVVQRPVYGQEDELNAPPQAVAPAGIVQSTQPRPVQSVFTNSKDNEFLQQMRDQAALNAAAGGRPVSGAAPALADYQKIFEVLYN